MGSMEPLELEVDRRVQGAGMVTSGTHGRSRLGRCRDTEDNVSQVLSIFVIIVEVGTKQNGNQLPETSFRGGIFRSQVSISAPKSPWRRGSPRMLVGQPEGAVGRSCRHGCDSVFAGKARCAVHTVLAVTREASTHRQTSARRQRLGRRAGRPLREAPAALDGAVRTGQ